MSKRLVLIALESLGLAVFVGLALYSSLNREITQIDFNPQSLNVGPLEERWMGVFFEDQPIGYSVSSQAPVANGGTLHQSRSSFRMVAMGDLQEISTAGSALVTAEGRLDSFEFFMSSDLANLSVTGKVLETEIVMQLNQASEPQELRLPFKDPPQISLSFNEILEERDLVVGQKFSIPYFDPVSLAQEEMQIQVDDVVILPGSAEEAYWLTTTFAGLTSKKLITPSGETIREESPMGMSMVRITREEAMELSKSSKPIDLIAIASVKVNQIKNSRNLKYLELLVDNVDMDLIPSSPTQIKDLKRITITSPLLQEIPREPRFLSDIPEDLAVFLASTPTLPSDHPEIIAQAESIVGGADRRQAARFIGQWVFDNLEKRSVLSVPNGLEVLRSKVGDCNEHTALYVSLARAAGIPARIAAGLVYSESMGEPGFYYHAWPEVMLGDSVGWVAVDPTFGQFPADATHFKLAEGDLDKQVQISGMMGQISLRVIKYR